MREDECRCPVSCLENEEMGEVCAGLIKFSHSLGAKGGTWSTAVRVRVREDKGMDETKIGCEHKLANAVMKWKYKRMKRKGKEGREGQT